MCGRVGPIIYYLMSTERENYLQVTFDRVRGLKLSWNFKDLSGREKYFRHLLILCSPDEAETRCLLENFYRRMKQGDLLACTYLHSFYGTSTAPWFEKTHLSPLRPAHYLRGFLPRSPDAHDFAALLARAKEEAEQFSEPVSVSFLLGRGQLELKLCAAIELAVASGSFAYSVNVFGAFSEPRLSFHRSINRFPLGEDHNQDVSMQLYHTFVNSASLKRVQLSIESVGGWLGVEPRSIWRASEFNRIETEFIGPAAMYDCDQLYFWKEGETGEEYELRISLEVELFSGKKWKTLKRCRITPSGDRDHCPTLQPHRSAPYVLSKHVTLTQNPFHSLTIVRHTTSVTAADLEQSLP